MSNVTYGVKFIGYTYMTIGSSSQRFSSLADAIKYGQDAIENMENYLFEVTDSRGVVYDCTGKQISGHKWVWWLKGEPAELYWIPSDVESMQCHAVNLTPPATAPIPEPTSNHAQPVIATLAIKAGAYHSTEAIAITAQALHDDAAHTTEVLLNLITELYQVLGALDAPEHVLDQVLAAIEDQPLPYETILPFITKHQAITRARSLGLSDAELKAMGVEV